MVKNKKKKTLKADVKNLKKVKNLKLRISVFAILMLLFASVFLFEAQLYSVLNNKDFYGLENAINQDVNLHFVDVGQGDAMAIRLPDDKKVLIDAGPTKAGDKLVNYLNSSFFLPKEEKVFDYFITSHSDEDHIGGGVKIFQAFQINMLLRPNIYTQEEADTLRDEFGQTYINDNNISNTNTLKNFVAESQKEPNLEVVIFNNLDLPTINGTDYVFTFLTPLQRTYDNFNDFSSIILFEYGQIKVLFTGDAGKTVEDQVISRYSNLIKDIDILKVGHHGSNSSTTENFVSLTKPRYSVIQVGNGNNYGHPTENVLNRLESVNSNILRNDLHGNVIVGFSKTKAVYTFVTTNTFLPTAVEVWQIYLSGGVILFYFVIFFDIKKIKSKSWFNTNINNKKSL